MTCSVVLQHLMALCNGSLIVDSIVVASMSRVDKAVKFIQPVDGKMAPQLNLAAVFSLVDLNALNKSDIVLEDQCHTRSEVHPTR